MRYWVDDRLVPAAEARVSVLDHGFTVADGVFETLKIQDMEVTVEYKGKLAGDELKLHRKVGEFAEYDIVAKRVVEKK